MGSEAAGKGGKQPQRIGKYEIINRIATGGMGAVYKARDVDLNRPVALKILNPELASRDIMLERFRREAKAAARLRHENIVAIYDVGEANGANYLALEFVEGQDLHDYINQKGRLDPEEARQILIQAAKALDHAHRAGVVHRDIKPSNFLITEHEGKLLVKLTDLGLARHGDEDDDESGKKPLTRAGTTIGTVDYMAPEQARKSSMADIRSDIYALGCTFYHMLGGKCPFPSGSLLEKIVQHQETEPPDVRKLNPEVPEPLVKILVRMLAKKPADRYQTPLELLKDLESPEKLRVYLDKSDRMAQLTVLADLEKPIKKKEPSQILEGLELPDDDGPAIHLPRRGGKRKRFRDEAAEDAEAYGKVLGKLPPWWPFVVGAAALVLVVWIVLSQLGSSKPKELAQVKPPIEPRKTGPDPHKEDDKKDVDKKEDDKKPLPKEEKKNPAFIGPAPPLLASLFKPMALLDLAALRGEMLGPFGEPTPTPAKARTVRVSRMGQPGMVRSLAEALAADGDVIVEIHDQGPLYETTVPLIKSRQVILRAGQGFRPLLVWEMGTAAKGQGPGPWLALERGSLILEDIDFVVKWPDAPAETSAALFSIRGGAIQARDCTFSLAGKNSRGVVLARLATPAAKTIPEEKNTTTLRLSRCYARGTDLRILEATGGPLDVLIEGSLLVTGEQPMFQFAGAGTEENLLRLVRSTLVTGQNLIRWQDADKGSFPRLKVFAWDALLARSNPVSAQGDLIDFGNQANSSTLTWKPVNCLYAGWKRLLHSADRTLTTGAMERWRAALGFRNGDQEISEVWPGPLLSGLEELPAAAFWPVETPAGFAASTGTGPLGCELGRLPPEPSQWLQRTYDRIVLPAMPTLETDPVPPIPTTPEGLYHGERVELANVDLGQLLATRLQSAKLGPRIVFHLAGAGKHQTSPIKFKGPSQLVLYFEPNKNDPLTLQVNPRTVDDRGGLIETEGAGLELHGARFHLDNKKAAAVPAQLIKMRGGNLSLVRSWLHGPMDKAPDLYQGLIRHEPADPGQPDPNIFIKDSVLLSARNLLDLRGSARLRAQNSVFLALDDAFLLTPNPAPRPGLFALLEANTFAFRKTLFNFRTDPEQPSVRDPIVIQAAANYFLTPFSDESHQAHLLSLASSAQAKGLLLWQGQANAFDHKKLQGYYATGETQKQPFKDWIKLWGSSGEQDFVLADPAKAAKPFAVDPPTWSLLALPPAIRITTGRPPHGADLVGLGIVKKK